MLQFFLLLKCLPHHLLDTPLLCSSAFSSHVSLDSALHCAGILVRLGLCLCRCLTQSSRRCGSAPMRSMPGMSCKNRYAQIPPDQVQLVSAALAHRMQTGTLLRCCLLWHLQLLFEEFGKWLNATADATMVERNDTFATVFAESQRIMDQPGTSLKGLGRAFFRS